MPIWSLCELFSSLPADTTMHPVLKSLGITDKVVFLMMGSVHGNKVKTVDRVINACSLNEMWLKGKESHP